MVHMHTGKDIGYRQGVGNIGFATAAHLAFVGLFRVEVSALYAVNLLRFEIGGKSVTE
jgi:hypothetical protein